ncbi:MAG TPA: SUMF1/EgtB/PvdO family nonheme iron enzyme [Solirubrobacteraceae bacterium]|jgi:formylglycine-generating enzyme required for sulfatase activity|nr:SUMF1/EgtB/PvdO family nonheme iron enzyme [Solirubrobacteraceae bacterium]
MSPGGLASAVQRALVDPDALARWSDGDVRHAAAILVDTTLAAGTEAAVQETLAIGAVHPHPVIRRAVVELASRIAGTTPAARALLGWAAADPDDDVALPALHACRRHGIAEAEEELFDQLHRAPSALRGDPGPGADARRALAAETLARVAERDPGALRSSLVAAEALAPPEPDLDGMVRIEGGEVVLGLDEAPPAPLFDVDHVVPARAVAVPPFWIDAAPVTNRQFDAFLAAVAEHGHVWCHHDEAPERVHRRAPGPGDAPVTGVDWYDASAYAAWAGKQLPSDAQWERAARGEEGRRYPWGDRFDAARCISLESLTGAPLRSRAEVWERRAERDDELWRAAMDAAAAHDGGATPEGVRHMSGLVWEWTRSRFVDGADADPRYRALDARQLTGEWGAYVAIRGGSWGSAAEQLLPAYRAGRLLLARSREIGFRCVHEPL